MVLPAPLGPSRPKNSPSPMSRLTPASALHFAEALVNVAELDREPARATAHRRLCAADDETRVRCEPIAASRGIMRGRSSQLVELDERAQVGGGFSKRSGAARGAARRHASSSATAEESTSVTAAKIDCERRSRRSAALALRKHRPTVASGRAGPCTAIARRRVTRSLPARPRYVVSAPEAAERSSLAAT